MNFSEDKISEVIAANIKNVDSLFVFPTDVVQTSWINWTVKNPNESEVRAFNLDQFTAWDKQISEKDSSGKKHVVERSWFTRGNKLIITGIKRDDTFIPKKYKNTEWPLFKKIEEIDEKGFILSSSTERVEVE